MSRSRPADLAADKVIAFVLWKIPWVFIAIGMLWQAPRDILWSIALAWIGGGCLANALRCGRVHCSVMGPSFLVLGLLSFAMTFGWLSFGWSYVWGAAGLLVLLAYLPEFFGLKYLRKAPRC